MQLGRDQAELISLRLLKRLVIIQKVGARVVHSLIEEQLVEVVAQIVVMRNVLLCLAGRVRLLEASQPSRYGSQKFLQGIRAEGKPIDREQCEKVRKAGA